MIRAPWRSEKSGEAASEAVRERICVTSLSPKDVDAGRHGGGLESFLVSVKDELIDGETDHAWTWGAAVADQAEALASTS